MAEIGIILSIASLVKLSTTVLTECATYIDKVKNAPAAIDKIINEVSGLEFILKRLSTLASSTSEDDARLIALKGMLMLPSGPFEVCDEILTEIAKKMEKITGSNVVRRRLLWPFEGRKLEELLKGLERHRSTLRTALSADIVVTQIATNDAVNNIGTQIEDMKASEERKQIAEWLRGADPSTNHNSARKKHESGTGDWLLNLKEFEDWGNGDGGVLWLYGIPGAGKTILSSTVMEHVKKTQVEEEPHARIAYYYFDFNDHAKQTAQGCIQSIVKQLFTQSIKTPEKLQSLYNESRHRTPSLDELTEVLIAVLDDGAQSFNVIDGLDEYKEKEGEMERENFFQCLQEIKSALKGGYNIFIASRSELDIKRELTELGAIVVCMEKCLVEEDIRFHLQTSIPRAANFKNWPEAVKKEIEDTLVKQANGMFRWAACQLDALKLCSKPASALRQLHDLPKTLEDTYARILQRVPSDNEREMRSILMLLAFSARPMTIQEVAEATAVNLETRTFSAGERFGDAYDILDLCSSLVSLSEAGSETVLRQEMHFLQFRNDQKVVAFAHFSVKDYIISDMVKGTFPKTFYVNESLSRRYLTEMCLIYLLDFNGGQRAMDIDRTEYPFLGYAALHWTTHFTLIPENERETITELLIHLFDPDHSESLLNYLNLYNPASSWNIRDNQQSNPRTLNFGTKYRNKRDFETPLYYACYYGIMPVVDALLALEAAASNGHDEIIQLLLKEGANANAQYCPQYFRPIQAAASSGSPSTIKLLLSAGADISPGSYGGNWGTALHVAASQGSLASTQALINAGHELDYVQIGTYYHGTALAVAANKGNDSVVACLIHNGADPKLFSHWHNYPLNLACENCSLESVTLILNAGVNIEGEGGHTALHEAAVRGDISIMKLLLDRGADINASGGTYGTPLKGAIQSHDAAVFKFMLDHGANINSRGSTTKYPVDQAIFGGNLKAAEKLLEIGADFSDEALAEALDHRNREYLVKELLKRGANPNAEHETYGNMLQLAIHNRCEEETIKSLLAAGADVNAVEGELGTALQAAIVRGGREEIMHLLFKYGAEPNMPPCGKDGNPLQAAVIFRQEPNIQLLLDKGADVNAVGGSYGTVLQAAAKTGNEDLVKLLLIKGVEVDMIGGEYGTALRAAIAMDHEPVVKLLLDAGADPNIKAEASHCTEANSFERAPFNSAVEVAIASGNTSMLQLLLDHGMELSTEILGSAFSQALNPSETEKKLKMVDYLISKGADIEKHGGMALFIAAYSWNKNIEVVKKLISLGTPLNFPSPGMIGSALMAAIDRGNKDVIQKLLNADVDINLAAGESGTALITAIDKGNSILAFQLLNMGADPNIKAGRWGTALAIAAKKGDDEIFYELLKRGADINTTYGYYGTALQAAISSDYYHLAYELLDRGADPAAPGLFASPLTCASGFGKSGQVELVERLITLGGDLDIFDVARPEDSGLGNQAHYNALQIAAGAGNEATIKLLLDARANINAIGGTYGTALAVAIKENHDSIIRLLLERGADVNLVGGEYGTALQAAAAEGRTAAIELLLEKGVDVNIVGGKYGTALQAACGMPRSEIVKELLARGAKVNTNCGKNGNPLQAAACSGRLKHIKTLLDHGANINLQGGQYGYALQAAACTPSCGPRDLDTMQYLLNKGANVNAIGGEYGTALQAAAYHHKPYVELLLKHGADPRIEGGKYGSTIGAAKEKGFNRVVKLLMLHMKDNA